MNIRRKFIFTLFAGALLPRWAPAQQDRVLRIAWLSNAVAENSPFLDAFRAGMRELGYVEGRNLFIDARWGAGSIERTEQLAVELAASKPDVIGYRRTGDSRADPRRCSYASRIWIQRPLNATHRWRDSRPAAG
jgi:putative ABC transport system substrate-binding protein